VRNPLLTGVSASVLLFVACNGGDAEPERPLSPSRLPATARPSRAPRPTPAPSPITSPTVPPESAGIDGFRAIAAQVDEAVANGDVEFFSGRAIVNDYTCTGQEEFTQACWDQQPGTMVQTFDVGFIESEGLGMTIAYYSDRFTEWFSTSHPELSDEYGGGAPVLHSLARVLPDQADSETYLAISTGIVDPTGGGPGRQVRISRWRFTDGRWRLADELIGGFPLAVADWLSGDCVGCYVQWERWEGITP